VKSLNSAKKYNWFEKKELVGWRVLIPRTQDNTAEMIQVLKAHGAVPSEVATISVEPPRTPQQMDRAVNGLVSGRYAWVGFTSLNAVRAIREKLEEYGLDARSFSGLKVAAVGASTIAALIEFGVKPDLVPPGDQNTTALMEEWPPYDSLTDPINRIFLPRADISTDTLVAGLTELGWEVEDITAFRTVRAAPPPAQTREAIKTGGFDAVLFTSSSTVRNLVGIAGKPHATTVVACIGPQTAKRQPNMAYGSTFSPRSTLHLHWLMRSRFMPKVCGMLHLRAVKCPGVQVVAGRLRDARARSKTGVGVIGSHNRSFTSTW